MVGGYRLWVVGLSDWNIHDGLCTRKTHNPQPLTYNHQNLTSPYIPRFIRPSFLTSTFTAYTRLARSSRVCMVFGVNSALSEIHATTPSYALRPSLPWSANTFTFCPIFNVVSWSAVIYARSFIHDTSETLNKARPSTAYSPVSAYFVRTTPFIGLVMTAFLIWSSICAICAPMPALCFPRLLLLLPICSCVAASCCCNTSI